MGLIERMTAESQVARDLVKPGITFRDESGTVVEVALPADRVEEAIDRVCRRLWPEGGK